MRLLLCFAACAAAAFLLGRATGSSAASAAPGDRVYVLRQRDTARFPAAATRCVASHEATLARLTCRHGRFDVAFTPDGLLVFRLGEPDDPVFAARSRP